MVAGSGFISFELLVNGGVITQSDLQQASSTLGQVAGMPVSLTAVNLNVLSLSNNVETQVYAIAGWIMLGITIILLFLMITLWSSANRAVSIMRSASLALAANSSLILFPLGSLLFILALAGWWVVVLVYVVSAGRVNISQAESVFNVVNSTSSSYDMTPAILFFHTFSCLWTALFLRAVLSSTTAGVVASWHWSERGKSRLRTSLYVTLRFQLGSVAMGRFVSPLFSFCRGGPP